MSIFYGVKKYKDKYCIYKYNHWLTEGKNLHKSDKYKENMLFDNESDAIKKANDLNSKLIKKQEILRLKRIEKFKKIKLDIINLIHKIKRILK